MSKTHKVRKTNLKKIKNASLTRSRSLILGIGGELGVNRLYSHRAGKKNANNTKNANNAKNAKNAKNANNVNKSIVSFQKEIALCFLEHLMNIKLFHWKTFSYASHKASDELYGKLNDTTDKFMEVLFGKTQTRIDIQKNKLQLKNLGNTQEIKNYIDEFKKYLVALDNVPEMKSMSNTDLYNIRDEILGDLNQFLYLLTLNE
jgi:hypothetical protein